MLLTPDQYAEYRKTRGMTGKSKQAVNSAIRSGRISTVSGNLIDPVQADKDWEANSKYHGPRAEKNIMAASSSTPLPEIGKMTKQKAKSTKETEVSVDLRVGTTLDNSRDAWAEAKARTEIATATLKEMEVDVRKGRLVDKEGVTFAAAKVAKTLQRALIDIFPAKISVEAVAITEPRALELFLQDRLRKELFYIIEELEDI